MRCQVDTLNCVGRLIAVLPFILIVRSWFACSCFCIVCNDTIIINAIYKENINNFIFFERTLGILLIAVQTNKIFAILVFLSWYKIVVVIRSCPQMLHENAIANIQKFRSTAVECIVTEWETRSILHMTAYSSVYFCQWCLGHMSCTHDKLN